MFYREAGQFKASYQADQQIFPIIQDRVGIAIVIALAALVNHFKPRALLVLGDDRTDAVMFEEALVQRERGLHVLIAGVSGGEETPPEIVELSDLMLHSTDEAIEALETVARALGV